MTDTLFLLIGIIFGYGMCLFHDWLKREPIRSEPAMKWSFKSEPKGTEPKDAPKPETKDDKPVHKHIGPPSLDALRQKAFEEEARQEKERREALMMVGNL